MAIATATPDVGNAPIPDPISFEEASAFFEETGIPAAARTLLRWAREDRLPLERRGRALVASYSDLLLAHDRRHPDPGR